MKPDETYLAYLRRINQPRHEAQSSDKLFFVVFTLLVLMVMFIAAGCGPKDSPNYSSAIGALQNRIDALEAEIQANADTSGTQLDYLANEVAALQAEQAQILAQQNGDEILSANLQAQINILQANDATLLATIAALSNYQIVAIVDPCGDQSGFDEVLLKLANGQYLAHFSHGNKQFLTLLTENVQYETTDGTGCTFSIVGGNISY